MYEAGFVQHCMNLLHANFEKIRSTKLGSYNVEKISYMKLGSYNVEKICCTNPWMRTMLGFSIDK